MRFFTSCVLVEKGRMMPHDLPACLTVYSYFQRWQRKGIWEKIHSVVRSQLRELDVCERQQVAIAENAVPVVPLK